jgi:hypothetical protein
MSQSSEKTITQRIVIASASLVFAASGIIATQSASALPVNIVEPLNIQPQQNFNIVHCGGGRLVTLATSTGASSSIYIGANGISGQGRHQRFHHSPPTNHHVEHIPWGGSGYGFAFATTHHRRIVGGSTQCGA